MNYQRMLEGKRVFVTTGARGIGKAIAILFARQGATVAVGGRNGKVLARTQDELRRLNAHCLALSCDLSISEQTESVCREILEHRGSVDILVNTVGINRRCPAQIFDDKTIAT